jgi:hypothetical protein
MMGKLLKTSMGITKRNFYYNAYKNSKGLNTIRTIGSLFETKTNIFYEFATNNTKEQASSSTTLKKKRQKRKSITNKWDKHNIRAN